MTKTYDFVTLYYKGHPPLKKQDHSYLMCLYTMLFVLFSMVIILLLFTFLNVEPTVKEVTQTYNTQQQERLYNTDKPFNTTKSQNNINYDFEETATPIVNWDHVKDFFFGSEETKEDNENAENKEAEGIVTLPEPMVQSERTNLKQSSQKPSLLHNFKTTTKKTTPIRVNNTQNELPIKIRNTTNKNTQSKHNKDAITHWETTKNNNFMEWQIEPMDSASSPTASEEVEWISKLQNQTTLNRTERFEMQKDCESPRCKMAASTMLSSMDLSVEPCRNFYSFACGVSSSARRSESELFRDVYTTAKFDFVKKISWFYKSCLDHQVSLDYRDRIKTTKKALDKEKDHKEDLTDVFARLILLDAMPFFNIDIDVNNSTFILKLIPPEKTLSGKYWSPFKETRRNCLRTTQPDSYNSFIDITFLYYDYENCQKKHHYVKNMQTAMDELGFFGNLSIKDTIEFVQKDLLSILEDTPAVPNLQEKIVNLDYTQMKIGNLQELCPIIDWKKLLTKIQSSEIKLTTTLQVYDKTYFENLFEKISLLERSKLMNSLIAILNEKYYQDLILPTPNHSRVTFCNNLSRKLFPDISNYLLKKKRDIEEFEKKKVYVIDIFERMKQNYNNVLRNEMWLDELSRDSMINKVNNLKLKIETNDIEEDANNLNEFYSSLKLNPRDFSFNYKEAIKFRRKNFFSLHGKLTNTKTVFENFVDHSQVESVFFYGHDIVYIPDSVVVEAFPDLPQYLVMAKIGFQLAETIGHLYDPVGLKFVNLTPNVTSLYKHFVRDSKRTLPHHITYNNMDLVFSLNNKLSVAERISENAAMSLLSNSMEEIQHQSLIPLVSFTFSREKIFFIALVQEFCRDVSLMEFVVQAHESAVLPAQFRVQNILKNSEAFHSQFSCRPSVKSLQFPHLSDVFGTDVDKIT